MRTERYYCNRCGKMVKSILYFEEGPELCKQIIDYTGTLCKGCYADLKAFIGECKGKELTGIDITEVEK